MVFNLVYFIVLTSVLLQGTTIPLLARWLGVAVAIIIKALSLLVLPFAPNVLFALPVTLGSFYGGLKAGLLGVLSIVLVINQRL